MKDRAWIHRRVDSMTFTDALMVRVWTSIDFTIPPEAVPFAKVDGEDVFYLPVTILAKWPPVMRFDLRDEKNRPVSLLTTDKNREVDAALLRAMAPEHPSSDEAPRLCGLLGAIARKDELHAAAAQTEILTILEQFVDSMSEDDRLGWGTMRQLIAPLVSNSLLWARVTGRPDTRKIVKYGFEQPVAQPLFFLRSVLGWMSWRETSNVYAIPRVDWAQNYHLQIDAPAGLLLHGANLVLKAPQHSVSPEGRARPPRPSMGELLGGIVQVLRDGAGEVGRLTDETREAARQRLAKLGRFAAEADPGIARRPIREQFYEPAKGAAWAWPHSKRAYLYVSRPGDPFAVAKFSFIAPPSSVRGPFVAAVILAALMTTITVRAAAIALHDGEAVTALVVVPAVIGALVFRPGEHPLVRRHIVGVRAMLVLAGAAPVLAAIVLLTQTHATAKGLLVFFVPLAVVAWLAAAALGLSMLLPAKGYPRG